MSAPPASSLPQVVIVGRPNVGKSTLFNRIVGRREAIVGSHYGMTRDRHSAEADWNGRRFALTDTGGLEEGSGAGLAGQVEQQVMAAVKAAAVVLLVVDGRAGPLPVEAELAARMRREGREPILVINKCDTPERAAEAELQFHELGVPLLQAVSAEHGLGVNDLLDAVTALLPVTTLDAVTACAAVRVAVVGRPNVGKSSLVNALLGADRVIVSDEPGTTRDPIDTVLERDGRRYVLIDTAGIRRRSRVDTHAEIASVAMARRRLTAADVALLVVDVTEGVTRQDMQIAVEADHIGCGLVVVVNKWDLIDRHELTRASLELDIRDRLGSLRYARLAVTSVLDGTGLDGLLAVVDEVAAARARRVPTADLNTAFERMVSRHAPAGGTSATQPKYVTQVGVNPPRFVAFAGGRGAARADYVRYLENRLRESFDFRGTPIAIDVRRSGKGRGSSRAG